MASKIEDDINALQDYIDGCKMSTIHRGCLIIDQNELDGYIDNLRTDIPQEIRQYQRIISNQEHILAEARRKADDLIKEAEMQTDQLVSEHKILEQAYARANELVLVASKEAESILDKATMEANEIKESAMAYTDDNLRIIQEIITATMEETRTKTDNYMNQMQGYLDIITSNRAELAPAEAPVQEPVVPEVAKVPQSDAPSVKVPKKAADDTDDNSGDGAGIDVPDVFFNQD